MIRLIFRVVVVLLLVALLGAIGLYAASLDWGRSHSARVSNLPLYEIGDPSGDYRIAARQLEYRARWFGAATGGPGVILLHGFPESLVMWGNLGEQLAAAGYRVLAFDQRGYSPGARPGGADAYHITELVRDVFAIADAVQFQDFHLVGHDWGAMVGWDASLEAPDRVRSWTAISVPHIYTFLDGMLHDPEQAERSGYVARLKRPILPEFVFTLRRQKYLKTLMSRLPANQLEDYLAILAEPGALTATLNWYRALNPEQYLADNRSRNLIEPPTLFIWGTNDRIITPSLVPKHEKLISGYYRELKLDVGHNPVEQQPEAVINAVLNHLRIADSTLTQDDDEAR